jgi:hypothetical protein
MTKLNRLAAVSLCLGLLACAKGASNDGGTPDAGSTACNSGFDCSPLRDGDGGVRTQVCIEHKCVPTCSSNAQCSASNVCEDGVCTAPGCGSASDCGAGQICSGGSCTPAFTSAQVGSCEVTPNPAVVAKGKVQLAAIAKDRSGKAIPFSGFTWNATGAGTVTSGGLVSGSGAGPITVTATAGNSASCSASVASYGDGPAAGTLRVVVINEFSKRPVEGATVLLGGSKITTGANGVAIFAAAGAGPYDVHVFASSYDYFSILGAPNNDVLVPLMPNVAGGTRSGFKGTMGAADFAPLNIPNESVHLAFFGSGVPGSPIDIGVQTLIGQLRPVTIMVAGQTRTVPLPSGLVLGISDNMFGTQEYKIYAEPGKRVLWGIGGNLNLTSVVGALGPLVSGGTANIDVGSLLAQILPLVGKLQAGQVVGVEAPPNGANATFETRQVPLNTPLRLRATLRLPDLPKQDGKYLGGAVALGGSLAYPLGFVPLGLTAGLAHKDPAGENTAKVLDPTCDTSAGAAACATSKLPMRVAPLSNGLEGQKWGFVALAANLSGLSLPGTATSGSTTLGLSGLVKARDEVRYLAPPADGDAVELGGRPFMNLPNANSATLTRATREVVVPASADPSAKFVRVGVQAHSGLNWNIWRPVTGGTIHLPDPTLLGVTGLIDPLADTTAADSSSGGPSSLLLHVSLPATTAFADVSGFGNVTLDQLGATVEAFTLISVKVQ